MEDLIPLIKDKDELRGISDDYVRERLEEWLEEYPGFLDIYEERSLKQFQRSAEYKIMLKDVRAKLREVYGVFFLDKQKKLVDALKELKKNPSPENHRNVLALHRSSQERLEDYEEIYKQIFEITGKPERILDLACGLNPFSYPFLDCEPEYLCSDISPFLASYIQEYFDFMEIDGNAFVFDLLKFKDTEFSDYAESDVCFLFKALDSLETIERDISERLILGLPARHIVVSFPRQSLGGSKNIQDSRRNWFEKMLEKNNLEFEYFTFPNESFYVVTKD